MANVYEDRAREKKVVAIIEWLDALATGSLEGVSGVPISPNLTSQNQAAFVASLGPETWDSVCLMAGVNPGSDKTRKAVVGRLRRRVLIHNRRVG